MGLSQWLERLVPDFAATLLRFPVPATVALVLCVWFNIDPQANSIDDPVVTGAAAAFLAAGSGHLAAEGRSLPKWAAWLLALAAGTAAFALGLWPAYFHTNALFLIPALAGVLTIAPFLRPSPAQGAIWLFNLRLGMAALIAFVVALLFAAGLSALVGALDALFDVRAGTAYEHIWLTAASAIAPLYGLSLVPRETAEEVDISPHRGSLLDRGISVLVNYIAAPVIAAYALILHAYGMKIMVAGELPRGQIAVMVTVFAIGGTAIWLIAWPWREAGTRLLREFMRWWYFLLIVPAVLLAIAIWRRLADYGVTPDRYGIALVAIWVAGLALYLAARRNRADMRAILGAMALLLLLGSFGPWGANGLTFTSQYPRLVALLERNGILKNGRIETPARPLPAEQSSAGYSIIYLLHDIGSLHRLQPLFEGDAKSPFASDLADWSLAQALNERLGFAAPAMTADYLNLTANRALAYDTPSGGQILGPFQAMRRFDQQPQTPMTAQFDDTTLTILLDKQAIALPLHELMAKARGRQSVDQSNQPPVSFSLPSGETIVIDSIFGNMNGTPPLGNMRFWIIRQPPP